VGVGLWVAVKAPPSSFPLAEARPLPWNVYWATNLARGAIVLVLLALAGRKAKWWSVAVVVFAIADASFMHKADAARVPREFFEEPQPAQGITERGRYRLFHKASWQEVDLEPVALAHFLAAPDTDRLMGEAMFRFAPAAFGFRGVLEQDLDQTALLTSDAYLKAALDVKKRTGDWHPFFLESANVRWVAEFLPLDEANRRGQPVEIREAGRPPRYWFARRLLSAREPVELADHIVTSETRPGDAFVDGETFAPAPGRVLRVEERPARVTIDAESSGRSFLVAAITSHKYWRATLDGAPAPIVRTNLGFQGVEVPAGRHRIELRYRNPRILPALIVSVLALVAAIVIALPLRAGTRVNAR
jgi:hypothetical protein